MKNHNTAKAVVFLIAFFSISFISFNAAAQAGKIAEKVMAFKQRGSFVQETTLFTVAVNPDKKLQDDISRSVKTATLIDVNPSAGILSGKPSFLRFTVPVANGQQSLRILLYKESISPNGFTLLTSDGKHNESPDMVHYKGCIDGDLNSLAAFSFSNGEVMGFISNRNGNYVIGKLNNQTATHIIYNDRDLRMNASFDCRANTSIPLTEGTYLRGNESTSALTTKCVNWYWETDYDLFVSKGSVAAVTSYLQGVFNQVATLYANDGVSITLKTLFVWDTVDPYTGTSTSNYLDQFGVNRTSFDGDLATLIGLQGGGGIAWINGLCNSQAKYKMAYCGINNSFQNVPTYSWTVEVITHEQGHLLGSRHTHDCVWNGNNTKIDGCGDNAGYTSGTCANPGNPAGGGTIMSYCHLLSGVGINFNNGFGPQPKTLIVNNVNNASCLTNCSTGCTTPDQPSAITGSTSVCASTAQTYSVTAIAGATGYTWTLPSGWTGSSTTNSITVTIGSTSGSISVAASNSCGSGTSRSLAVSVSSAPAQPATISGNAAVCPSTTQTYSVTSVAGATSYTWTLPSGWTGSSSTNSINTTSGSAGGTISVKANNTCGSGSARTLTVSITAAAPAQPGGISGNTTVCSSSAQTYSVAAVSGASSYTWTLPTGWTGSSTTNSITVTAGTTGGIISVKANNGCGSSTARALTIAIGTGTVPARPGAITVAGGTAKVCSGDTRTYSVSAVAGMTYNWTAPAGGNITSGQGTATISITFTPNFTANGVLSVTANSCGTSSPRTLTIAKNTLASPAAISGPSTMCNGQTGTYTATAVAGATSYAWTVPSGATIQGSATGNVINFLWGSTAGTIAVKSVNACGVSGSRSFKVTKSCTGKAGETILNADDIPTTVYPNPVTDVANVRFSSKESTGYIFMVTDVSGRKLRTEIQQAVTGINIHSINLSGIAKGTYFIIVQSKNGKETFRITTL
ncbi:MAG: T9SS type A sorting domain-containing protein [Bacteroidetes bacterium]|nr:T9SS type A sorting domain-containing protein [Bacteroidota bacterium]